MKFLSVLTFAATAAAVVLPAERRQTDDDDSIENYTFLQFPETGATCKVFDFSEKFFPSEQLKEWAYGERFTNPYDESAANVASGRCVSLRGFPFFWSFDLDIYVFGWALDRSTKTIYWCNMQGQGVNPATGWREICTLS